MEGVSLGRREDRKEGAEYECMREKPYILGEWMSRRENQVDEGIGLKAVEEAAAKSQAETERRIQHMVKGNAQLKLHY